MSSSASLGHGDGGQLQGSDQAKLSADLCSPSGTGSDACRHIPAEPSISDFLPKAPGAGPDQARLVLPAILGLSLPLCHPIVVFFDLLCEQWVCLLER